MRKLIMEEPPVLDYSGRESLNMICTNLSFIGKSKKRILTTSCVAGEGKTTMTLRIAQNLASRGKKIAFVDADMRKSHLVQERKIHTTEGEMFGLAHVLAEHCNVEDALYEVEGLPGVSLMPIGREVFNPVELLDGLLFGQILDRLAEQYDMVLVDCPPIGLVADAAEVAKYCDGAILVVEYSKRHRSEVQDAVRQLSQSGCPIIGGIIDRITVKSHSQKQYYKSHYYYGKYGYYYNKDNQ